MTKAEYPRDIYVVNVGMDYEGEYTVGAFTARADAREHANKKEVKSGVDSVTIYRYRGSELISDEMIK